MSYLLWVDLTYRQRTTVLISTNNESSKACYKLKKALSEAERTERHAQDRPGTPVNILMDSCMGLKETNCRAIPKQASTVWEISWLTSPRSQRVSAPTHTKTPVNGWAEFRHFEQIKCRTSSSDDTCQPPTTSTIMRANEFSEPRIPKSDYPICE